MALTPLGTWFLSVKFADRGGKISTYRYQLNADDIAGDAAAVLSVATGVIGVLVAATDCVIAGYQVEKRYVEDAFAYPTAPTAENEQLAMITAKIRGAPQKSATAFIPGPKDILFVAASGSGADVINRGQAQVDAFCDMYDNVGGSQMLRISDGEYWVSSTASGKRVHRKSTQG